VIGCNDVDGAVGDTLKDGLAAIFAPERRVHAAVGAELVEIIARKIEMMWTDLTGRAAVDRGIDPLRRRRMGDMNISTRFLTHVCCIVDGRRLGRCCAVGAPKIGVGSSSRPTGVAIAGGGVEAGFILSVNGDGYPLVDGTVDGVSEVIRSDTHIAGRIREEDLTRAVEQRVRLPVAGDAAVDPIIDTGLLGGCGLGVETLAGRRRWRRVRHIDDGGHAAGSRTPGAGCPCFLMWVSGLAEVDVGVDCTRQKQVAGGVDHRLVGGWIKRGVDRGDLFAVDTAVDGVTINEFGVREEHAVGCGWEAPKCRGWRGRNTAAAGRDFCAEPLVWYTVTGHDTRATDRSPAGAAVCGRSPRVATGLSADRTDNLVITERQS